MIDKSSIKTSYPWIALALASAGQFIESLCFLSMAVLYPFIQDSFTLTRAQVGLITAAYGAGGLFLVLLAGWLADSFGVKHIMFIALVSLALCMVLFPLASTFPILIMLSALIGITTAPTYPATSRIIMDWLPERIRGLAMSLKHAGVPLAGMLTAVVLPTLAITLGWRTTIALAGAPAIIIAMGYLLFYHDQPSSRVKTEKLHFSALSNIVRNRNLIVSVIWASVFTGFQFVILSYFIIFLVEELQVSAVIAGGLLAIAQFSCMVARILWGVASDFAFKGRRVVVLAMIGILTIAGFLGTGLLHPGTPRIVQVLIAIVIGVSALSFHGVFTALAGEIAEQRQVGTAVGIASTMFKISKIVFPPLFGKIVDTSNSYYTGWNIMAGLALISTLLLITLVREPKSQYPPAQY
ncbi:MFS transporter [Chloroflexota bacterium]